MLSLKFLFSRFEKLLIILKIYNFMPLLKFVDWMLKLADAFKSLKWYVKEARRAPIGNAARRIFKQFRKNDIGWYTQLSHRDDDDVQAK